MLFKMFQRKGLEEKKITTQELLGLREGAESTPKSPKEELPPQIVIVLNSDDNKYYQYDTANGRYVREYKEEEHGDRLFQQDNFKDARNYLEGDSSGTYDKPIPAADGQTVFEVPVNEIGLNQAHHLAVRSNASSVNASARGWD